MLSASLIHDKLHGAVSSLQNVRFGPVDRVVVHPCILGYGGFIGEVSRTSVFVLLQTSMHGTS